MTVERNYAIAIATLSDWFKNLAPVYQPVKKKTKTNRDLHARFSHGITTNLDWFIALFVPAVIGGSNYFGICFTTLNWKPLYNVDCVVLILISLH